MTLNDLNKYLSQLAENQTRENILEFAFTLLQWMQISPNTGNKPQLLSPQTQKLKDFLATAPQTVQPQLYRLSADGQNIRVRFAVLKKLKKDYIGQLVDNDPSLTSYQSFIKGIQKQSNGTAFVPTQPYFIHFVTTPDYDKLVLIFNQGEQKRIVTFRRRLTNTQYNKIIEQWQGIGIKSKPEIADILWKSLDIKEVNKEFYKQIKERFDALLGIIRKQHNKANENQLKQFTVRLIGRYIFCWFLKEKNIIPPSLISKVAITNTNSYYQNSLLKLFFETLNTKVQDRNPLIHEKLFEKIPYLNGGLFDESEEDKLFTNLNLDAWLIPFVDILESYDFTVDESSSQYQQVAVDPEMLGRIFENLLASQNEETEKLANQRKAFGAFYTPREIVDYMVNESIKAYLQTQWEQLIISENTKHINNPEPQSDIFGNKKPQQLAIEIKRYVLKDDVKTKIEKALEPLFTVIPDTGHLKKDEKNLLLDFLEKIKILDPACGSGAFPMGILHKLVELNELLGTVKSSYELKKDILSQNIYGVDIMPMAIEIARLRAWLSLVLEEEYKPNDITHNFGVKPLPNLDFKFVCGNSLIDLGLDAFIEKSKGTLHEEFTKKLVGDLKDLEVLRTKFFQPTLASHEKDKLKDEYFVKRDEVIADIESESDSFLIEIAHKIKHWNPFDDSHPCSFFSPTWMFGVDKGFDIVIGNPPYVGMSKVSQKELLKKQNFITFESTGDLYSLFYERSNQVLKSFGILTFITSNKWLRAEYGKSLRKYFTEKTNPIALIDFGQSMIFESAIVHSNILIFQKAPNLKQLKVARFEQNLYKEGLSISNYFEINKNVASHFDDGIWSILPTNNLSIREKVEKIGIPLKNWKLEFNRGLLTGCNDAFILDNIKKEELIKLDNKNIEIIKPILRGRDVRRYYCNFAGYWIINSHNGNRSKKINRIDVSKNYPTIYQHLLKFKVQAEIRFDKGDHWTNLRNCAYLDEFEKNKIVFSEIVSSPQFHFDDQKYYPEATVFFITGENLKYLIALLNSEPVTYFFTKYYAGGDLVGKYRYKKAFLENLPLPKINITEQQPFVNRVDNILSLRKKNQDSSSLEKEIDIMVYKLYDLSYEEVKMINKDFWLSEEEYENYKAD